MTKQTLGNRSHINQLKYSPKYQSVAIVGTNDGNAWIGFNLGTGLASQANWVNVTGGNTILPNRPVLNIALDPSVAAANVPVGYAAVGGFNVNTPTTQGHVFQVSCGADCTSFTWADKSGNLPDIPVDAVIVNPNFPQQVFAGTDFGLYFTDNITVASPTWYRFNNGLPNTMIWDMQIDRGSTTLSLWTRGRGAFAWPLPVGPLEALQLNSVASRKTHGGAGTFDIDLGLSATSTECRSGGGSGDYTMVFTFATDLSSVSSASVTSGTGTIASRNIGANPKEYIVNLTGVTNVQRLTVSLNNVQDVNGNSSATVNGTMKVLIGDSNNNSAVNSSDISQTKGQTGQTVTSTNFREDVTADGSINSSDISLIKSKVGTGLP